MIYDTLEIGKRIQKLRREKGLTQEQLSEWLNVSTVQLAKIETGKRGCSLDILIDYVMRAGWYAQGVDAAEEALPGIKQEILTGTIKPTETAVAAVAKAERSERPQLAAALRTSDAKTGGGRKKPSAETQYHTPKVST